MTKIVVGASPLTLAQLRAAYSGHVEVSLAPEAAERIRASAARVKAALSSGKAVYGINTGFGHLASTRITNGDLSLLQRSLVLSHATGVGEPVEDALVRLVMLLKITGLARGFSGARLEVVEALAALLNAGVYPLIPRKGSVGASGDLAPLAHCALALIGEGEVRDALGVKRPAAEALAAAGLTPVVLREKEGLALINGTDGMLGMLVLALADLEGLLDAADLAVALSVEGIAGNDAVFAPHLQALRPHAGQAQSAARIYAALQGSAIIADHKASGKSRVQDAYSLRCAPQVHGAGRDLWAFALHTAEVELASAIDNPVITDLGTLESNGNFHGAPVAYALDLLALPVADIASMSERRTDRLLDRSRSGGLNPFLADNPGVDSGLMIAQYTAAGIVSELKRLAVPASADSIPSSAMQEDHVSMGWAAGLKLRRAVDGLGRVLAIEFLAAARAIDLRAPLTPSPECARVVAAIRERVPGPGPDRWLAPEIEAVRELVVGHS